ncbi:MAG: hypothetical protein ACP5HU_11020 [Phycisphaerae bacterium]
MELMTLLSDLTSFGAAGLMGAMWLWERRLSRHRERQLDAAHERIERDEQRLDKLTEVVQRNTAAITTFADTQRQVHETLKDLTRELRHDRTY